MSLKISFPTKTFASVCKLLTFGDSVGKCVKPFSGEAVLFLCCSGMFLQVSFSSWTLWSLNLVLSSRSVCKCSRLSLYLLHPYSYWGHRPFFMHWSVVFQVDGSTMMLGTLGQGGVGRRHSMNRSFCGKIFCKNSFSGTSLPGDGSDLIYWGCSFVSPFIHSPGAALEAS